MADVASQINLHDLPIPQLQAVRQQLELDLQVLLQSFTKLKQALVKFSDCSTSLTQLTTPNALVPLTNSLYVEGSLVDTQRVIVDVGTGYYIEKSVPEAIEYYKRRMDYVKSNLTFMEKTVVERQNQQRVLMQVLQDKILQEKATANKPQ